MFYEIGEKVYHPSDSATFEIIDIQLKIKGDFSGGTHCVSQSDWVNVADVRPAQLNNRPFPVYPPNPTIRMAIRNELLAQIDRWDLSDNDIAKMQAENMISILKKQFNIK